MGDPTPPVSGKALQSILDEVAAAVKRIENRGGRVIFVRTPSSGPMEEGEQKAFPRATYWDALLTTANARGIHYTDYPQTASLICPEWSHLSPRDAVRYTKYLIEQLREHGWFS